MLQKVDNWNKVYEATFVKRSGYSQTMGARPRRMHGAMNESRQL